MANQQMILAAWMLVGLGIVGLPSHAQLTDQGRVWLPGNEDGDRDGEAVAFGDFNGDGFDDLAVGIPFEDLAGGNDNAGFIRIHFGGPDGQAQHPGNQFFREDSLPGGDLGAGDLFGASLAAADFNLDGVSDLAIGIPGETIDGQVAAGAIAIVFGSRTPGAGGLRLESAEFYNRSTFLEGSPQAGDRFGAVLAAGRLGNDTFPDLVISAVGQEVTNFDQAGAVYVMMADDSSGPEPQNVLRLTQDVTGAFGIAGPNDRFGGSLAIGDGTGDGVPDLVVGTPGDRVGLVQGAGAVQLFPGIANGVEISSDQRFWTQNSDGVLGVSGTGDGFGSAVAFGDFDGDAVPDLAIGVPGESQFGPNGSGAVQVFYGGAAGLVTDFNQLFLESLISPEIASFDRFGETLAVADFDGSGEDDLAVGYPLDNVFGIVNSGNVAILYGANSGLVVTGAQLWNGFTLLTVEPGDEWGSALAVGHFAGNQAGPYLAIGVPGRENDDLEAQAGGVMLMRSDLPIFSDGFESGDLAAWMVAQ